MAAQMHLLGFFIFSPISHAILAWSDPDDRRLEGLHSFRYWEHIARTLERGRYDGVFFADSAGVFGSYKNRADEAVKYGVCWPTMDPMPLVAVMAAATEYLSLAKPALSVSGRHPYLTVRTLSTLDYLTNGRIGWNVVTGHNKTEYEALGLQLPEHDTRYDLGDEYMAVCNALWEGVSDDSFPLDRNHGVLIDPDHVHKVDHKGTFYEMHALPPVMPSPQGKPVIFQAGSSGRGQQFASTHAEVVFSIQPHLAGMKRFMQQSAEAAQSVGRKEPVRVSFGVQPIVGASEAAARERQAALRERIPMDAALARISGSLGVDFSKFGLDTPMEDLPTNASRGLMSAMSAEVDSKRFTLREAASRWGASTGMPQIVGTATQVADQLESLWRETGCHGFNTTWAVTPRDIEEFVDGVVPILQERGIMRKEYAGKTFRENVNN